MEEDWCCDWCEEQKNRLLNQIGVLQNSLNQMNQMYGQRMRHFEFLFQRLENQFGTLDQEFVNQTDNAQTIAKIYDMQERQNVRWTQFESDLKVAFVKFYEKIQNEILTRVTSVQSLSTPSHQINPAFDAVLGRPGLSRTVIEKHAVHESPRESQPAAESRPEPLQSSQTAFVREQTVPASLLPGRDDITCAMSFPEKEKAQEVPVVGFMEGSSTGGRSCSIAQVGFAPGVRAVQNSFAPQHQIPIAFASTPIQAHMANRAKQPLFTGVPGDYQTFCENFELFWESLGGGVLFGRSTKIARFQKLSGFDQCTNLCVQDASEQRGTRFFLHQISRRIGQKIRTADD